MTQTVTVKFVGRKIAHTWQLNGKEKIYKGNVIKTVKGKDGGKRTVYRVEYTNGEVENVALYSDYSDGCIKFL